MSIVKPADLTEQQWLLLRHLHRYSAPFYTAFLYKQFSKHQIDRIQFYYMFYGLVILNYIRLVGYRKREPGRMQDFCFVVTPKGKTMVAEYTQTHAVKKNLRQLAKVRAKEIMVTYTDRTIRLKDYSFDS